MTLGDGVKSTFSVAYQIKGNHKFSNLVANIMPATPSPPPPDPRGQKLNIQLFQNMVILHVKLKGMEHRAPW